MAEDQAYHISPSQLAEWNLCKRKWAWRYVAKIKSMPHASAQLGTEVHALLEEFAKTRIMWSYVNDDGTPRRAARIAEKALPFLPPPGAPFSVEGKFTFPSFIEGGRPLFFSGFRDLLEPGQVTDYKTTSNFRYAKTEEDLLTDPQGVIYAYEALQTTGAETINLRWLYLHTGTPKAKAVEVRVHRDGVKKEFRRLEVLAREIERVHHGCTDPLDLPPEPTACESFGGCPHRSRCNLSLEERQLSMANFMDQIAQQNAAQQTPQPATHGWGQPPPGVTYEQSYHAARPGYVAPVTPVAPPAWQPPPAPIPQPAQVGGWTPQYGAPQQPLGINPPETVNAPQPQWAQAPAPAPTTPALPAAKRTRRTKEQLAIDNAAKLAQSEAVHGNGPAPDTRAAELAAAHADAQAKFPTSYANANPAYVPLQVSIAPPSQFADAISPVAAIAKGLTEAFIKPETKHGYTLYINCAPQGRDIPRVDDFIAHAKARITKETGQPDYRMVQYVGSGMLTVYTLEAIKASNPGELVLYTTGPEGQCVSSDVISGAGEVVR